MDDRYPFSRLEDLAYAAGVDPWDVRDWLRAEIERRQHEQSEQPELAPETAQA